MMNAEQTAMDDWVARFESRDDMADEYAALLRRVPPDSGIWPVLNLAIIDRWSMSGLRYIKERAWKLAEKWDEGPCYICGVNVAPAVGWHREDFDGKRRHWCIDHQPVWSRKDRSLTRGIRALDVTRLEEL